MKYISIIRGINVSGKNSIKMDALRKMYENMGFHDVTTYIQSGNVIFRGKEFELNEIESLISQQIFKDFGFDVPIIVLSVNNLRQIINNNPFINDDKKDISYLHVTFLASNPDYFDKQLIECKKQNGEEIIFSEKAIYLYCPNGYGRTKLTNNFLENKLKVITTTRNWKTTILLLKIAEQIQ